ncbi:hypothetical protein [Roseobacter litoralis]|uniref:Uncharacterized protein n=1 Tax=Roseobacter litoralis (strain ATCC 49566 / DSM 6996 / JCM 21268 / NBRC 15278 / OCh 149) TaxID=391595 RepID=F7ZBK8_ROSLO|nr:hypothetical protein [Roseobacter litoralis]AEI95590.1 hypothetical protein RLO149_c036680 [Roseobacter litoralis Och 149]
MSDVNEGIALTLGAPVDLMTGALNIGMRGINAIARTELPQIESPVGGSDTMRSFLASTISEAGPQNGPQRYARRIGQEVGLDEAEIRCKELYLTKSDSLSE